MFSNMHEQMEIFECVFDIDVDGKIQSSRIQAPRIALEQQFISLVKKAAYSTQPIKVKMSREVPIYDEFDSKWISREHSVTFVNNAYVKIKGEDL